MIDKFHIGKTHIYKISVMPKCDKCRSTSHELCEYLLAKGENISGLCQDHFPESFDKVEKVNGLDSKLINKLTVYQCQVYYTIIRLMREKAKLASDGPLKRGRYDIISESSRDNLASEATSQKTSEATSQKTSEEVDCSLPLKKRKVAKRSIMPENSVIGANPGIIHNEVSKPQEGPSNNTRSKVIICDDENDFTDDDSHNESDCEYQLFPAYRIISKIGKSKHEEIYITTEKNRHHNVVGRYIFRAKSRKKCTMCLKWYRNKCDYVVNTHNAFAVCSRCFNGLNVESVEAATPKKIIELAQQYY